MGRGASVTVSATGLNLKSAIRPPDRMSFPCRGHPAKTTAARMGFAYALNGWTSGAAGCRSIGGIYRHACLRRCCKRGQANPPPFPSGEAPIRRPSRVPAASNSGAATTKRIRERQASLRACATKGRSRSLRYRSALAPLFIVRLLILSRTPSALFACDDHPASNLPPRPKPDGAPPQPRSFAVSPMETAHLI